MNTFSWDLRYPGARDFEGMIIWSARPTRGPKAPLGKYKVRMKAGGMETVHDFALPWTPT